MFQPKGKGVNISDSDIWNLAQTICQRSNLGYKHAAILVKNHSIVSSGFNFRSPISSRDLEVPWDIKYMEHSVHAEADCLLRLKLRQKKTAGGTIYVYGESRCGNIINSKPCKSCQRLIRMMRVYRVKYITPGGIKELNL